MTVRTSDITHDAVASVPGTVFNDGVAESDESLRVHLERLLKGLHPLANRRLEMKPDAGPEVVEAPRTYTKEEVDEVVGVFAQRVLDVFAGCTDDGAEHAAGHLRVVAHGMGVRIPDE